jgi:hypothetical protein
VTYAPAPDLISGTTTGNDWRLRKVGRYDKIAQGHTQLSGSVWPLLITSAGMIGLSSPLSCPRWLHRFLPRFFAPSDQEPHVWQNNSRIALLCYSRPLIVCRGVAFDIKARDVAGSHPFSSLSKMSPIDLKI